MSDSDSNFQFNFNLQLLILIRIQIFNFKFQFQSPTIQAELGPAQHKLVRCNNLCARFSRSILCFLWSTLYGCHQINTQEPINVFAMIYHSRSYLGLMIFLEYALSAAVSASRSLSLFFTNYFGIIRQPPLYNFYPFTDFSVRVFERDFFFIHFTSLLRSYI